MIGKVCILGTKQAKQGIGKQVGLFQIELRGLVESHSQEMFANFTLI